MGANSPAAVEGDVGRLAVGGKLDVERRRVGGEGDARGDDARAAAGRGLWHAVGDELLASSRQAHVAGYPRGEAARVAVVGAAEGVGRVIERAVVVELLGGVATD